MVKYFVLLFNMLGVLLLNLLSGEVIITTNIPQEVTAGSDFIVEVTIQKGDLVSFARFQQELPLGMTATSGVTENADFKFKDQKAKFLWLRLPEKEEFTVSYNVHVDETVEGSIEILGQFSYIDKNERKTVNVQAVNILVKPAAILAEVPEETDEQQEVVDETPVEEIVPEQYTAEGITCTRQQPQVDPATGEIIVNILVDKGSMSSFAKIEEQVPEGFTAVNVESMDGIFTFIDNTAKFLWMNLPSDEKYVVTYKLIPDAGKTIEDLLLTGNFSYIKDGQTQSVQVPQKDLDLSEYLGSDALLADETTTGEDSVGADEIIAQTEMVEEIAEVAIETVEPSIEELVGDVQEEVTEEIVEETPVVAEVTEQVAETVIEEEEPQLVSIPSPESGVSYRIQICALQKYRKPIYFNKKRIFNIKNEVQLEAHDGWNKYTVGSFGEYKSARDHRVQIWETTPIKGAFVSAYNNGNRITVQEALMIANQKWYK